jgi:hypothetical protein
MSELTEKPQPSPEAGAQQSSPPNSGEAFRGAENLRALQSEDGDERGRQAFVAIEDRGVADPPSNLTGDSDAPGRRITGDQSDGDDEVEPATDAEVEDALDEKTREDGIAAANDTSQIVWDLTPHNL